MFRFMGLFALAPMTIMLTISFFVLFTLQKVEKGALKTFGQVVAVLLWIVAALALAGGIFIAAGCGSWCQKMHGHGPAAMYYWPGCAEKAPAPPATPAAPRK